MRLELGTLALMQRELAKDTICPRLNQGYLLTVRV
jgi:hypothetical protein